MIFSNPMQFASTSALLSNHIVNSPIVRCRSNEGLICRLLWEQHTPNGGQQLFKQQSDSRIQRIITHNDSITAPQKNTTNDMLILLLKIVLRYRQFGFHLPTSLVDQDLAEAAFAIREKSLRQANVFLFELDVDISLHESQHSLNDQLLGKILINPLIQSHLPQSLIHLMSQFLHKFIAGLHAADAMPVVQGRLIAKSIYILHLFLYALCLSKQGELMLDFFLLRIVNFCTLLVRLLVGAFDDCVGALLGLCQDGFLHFFDALFDVSCHHFFCMGYIYIQYPGNQAKETQGDR